MRERVTDEQLDAIESTHQQDYDSMGGCACAESYPCTTLGLVAEVRFLRAERDHFSSWIVAMLDDDHLWREQGEERLRWNVQTMLRGALHYAQVGDTDE